MFLSRLLHRTTTRASVLASVVIPQLIYANVIHADEPKRPNMVIIMTDDQGYGDLSITGNDVIETPNMDRVATEGAWLKHFYVSPVCTPTRANLMTGRYNYRTRAIDTYLGRAVMEPEEITIAEVLSQAGYATGIFGKWHLGDYYPTRSIDQGFQESLVHQGGGLRQPSNPPDGERYHDPILFHNGKPKRYEGYCTDIFFDSAIEFIERNAKAEKPFFAYIPTNAPHGPFDEPPSRELMESFQAKFPNDKNSDRAGFYAMIKNIDENLGRLLEKLKVLNIENDTLVIFLTDNGPSAGSAGPFRDRKGSVYEGGIRTVCFLRWPGVIKAGTSSEHPAAHIDLMPTILDLCRVSEPQDVEFDGRSLRPLLSMSKTNNSTEWPDRYLSFQWHRGNTPQKYHHFATIGPKGTWKLLHNSPAGKSQLNTAPKLELYNLDEDQGETRNLAAEHPEIVAELREAYEKWFDDVSTTRDPNFGMPLIVIGSARQKTVVLTPQDKRIEDQGQGWWASGHWPVDVQDVGPYTIKVLLTAETDQETIVEFVVRIGDQQLRRELTVPRGVDSAAIGNIELPAKGLGRVTVRPTQGGPRAAKVYQVTIK